MRGIRGIEVLIGTRGSAGLGGFEGGKAEEEEEDD